MSVFKLYYNCVSPPCRTVHMVTKALKLNVKLIDVDILTQRYLEQLQNVNPQHTIPVLNDTGFILWDSHAISAYLVNRYGPQKLYPEETKLRALVDQRLHFDSGILYPTLRKIIVPIMFFNRFGLSKMDVIKIKQCYEFMDIFMGKSSIWLCGDEMTIADLSCLSTVSTMDMMYPIKEDEYPNLKRFLRNGERLPYYNDINLNGLNKLSSVIQQKFIKHKEEKEFSGGSKTKL
ncbi:PREDICTED: glutathione S-transferase 1-like [Nicrophorus vespilloides]|uniref:Glutathione S-transferase 1-like n=1 Tax=Nicrophorus vespilloides TaxID=110193 RepID=A0ABM1N6W0_NICVS|nr:PREDICTED: glutathione S-transferase 1-like [Nicrophorus vespilloides]